MRRQNEVLADRNTSGRYYVTAIASTNSKTKLATREDRIEELEAQLAERSQVEEKIEDLPAKIRDEMTYQERRQRMLDQASLTQRLRWKVTGVPVDED